MQNQSIYETSACYNIVSDEIGRIESQDRKTQVGIFYHLTSWIGTPLGVYRREIGCQ